MNIEQQLTYYGLDSKEAKIYLACLQLGKETAFEIARRAGLKRTTAYNKLNELNTKGLVTISQNNKATIYTAVSPKKLLQQLEFRKKHLQEILPEMMALYKDRPGKPRIQTLHGKEGIEYMYTQCIESLESGNEIIAFSSLEHFQHPDYAPLIDLFAKQMKKKKFAARELLNANDYEIAYAKKIQKQANFKHQIRIANRDTFVNDNLIYSDTLAIFSFDEELFVTLIESQSISQSYRNLFNLAWKQAKEIR